MWQAVEGGSYGWMMDDDVAADRGEAWDGWQLTG